MPTPEEMQRREEVSRVKVDVEQDLLNLPNVTGVFTGRKVTGGVDTGQVAIVVTVSEKKDVPAKQAVPKEINGVPTDVIEEKIEPMLVPMRSTRRHRAHGRHRNLCHARRRNQPWSLPLVLSRTAGGG